MSKARKKIKVVLDTNVLVSALIFTGDLHKIVDLWQKGSIVPFFSRETFQEFRDILQYPKFSLSEDDKFLACAISALAHYIVSGDKALCDVKEYKSVRIITPSELIKLFFSSNVCDVGAE